MSPDASTLEAVVLGGAAGSISEIVVLPALVVRTRMMVQGADSSIKAYSSFSHALRTIYQEEGVGAFYKGLGLNVLFTPLARGLYMGGAEVTKAAIGEGTAIKDFAAGMNAQLVASIAYVPRDIVVERCAIEIDIQPGHHCARHVELRHWQRQGAHVVLPRRKHAQHEGHHLVDWRKSRSTMRQEAVAVRQRRLKSA